jgi:nicotinate-nucleotide adenylyltransferase
MKRIGIYGGAFDPCHIGHKHVVSHILAKNIVDEVWIIPSYRHFHGKSMVAYSDRCMMCELMFADFDCVCIKELDEEITLSNPEYNGSTIDFMSNIRTIYTNDEYDFYIIIGYDNAVNMRSWNRGDELIQLEKFIIIPRDYVSPQGLSGYEWYLQEPHKLLSNVPIVKSSSTEVRHLFSLGYENGNDDTLKTLLGHDVFVYTKYKKLYKEQK